MTERYGKYILEDNDDDSCGDCGSNRSTTVFDNELKRDVGTYCLSCQQEEIYNLIHSNEDEEEENEEEDDELEEEDEEY
ncbi:hypothetical protein [Paenibacillus polymyxa]|uniref:hypothetical protein n=1 Tax=Paenibacillus TaxID=44249 RepID=UPI000407DDC2|nr:hypothetical protein [Paenibacillus polymyxa]